MKVNLLASTRWKILAALILGLILPVAVAAWHSYRTAREIIYRQSILQQSRILDQISRDLLSLQDQSRHQIQSLAGNPLLRSALDRKVPVPAEMFRTQLDLNPDWTELAVFDETGEEIWRSGSTEPGAPFDPFFLETFLYGFNQGPLFQSGADHLTRFGATIDEEGDFRGVITATLRLSRFERRLRGLRRGSSIGAVVWDDRGVPFASNLSPSEWRRLNERISLRETSGALHRSVRSLIHRELSLEGRPYLFLATLVPEFISRLQPLAGENWYLAILTPAGEAFGELRSFQRRILWFLLILSVAVVAVMAWLTRRISRPLEEMAAFAGRVSEGERRIRLPDQGRDEVGRLAAALNSMTESLRISERELIRSEVLASLGKMSSLVAHEIRNPLNAIRGSIQYLEIKRPRDKLISEYSQIIVDKISSLTRFVESLLKLARFPEPRLSEAALESLVSRACEPLRERLDAQRVEIRVRDPEALPLRCDEGQISELFQNLIQNGLEAMPGGGVIEIATRVSNGFQEIEVRDSGPGIARDIEERLFVPLSTSKPHGTGLGLVLCRMIAEGHGGSLENVPARRGACFILRIPLAGRSE